MAEKGGTKNKIFHLKPISERKWHYLFLILATIIWEIIILILFLGGLGIIPGSSSFNKPYIYIHYGIGFFILLFILGLIIFEVFLRVEATISNDLIIVPGRGFLIYVGLERRKKIKWKDITQINSLGYSIDIESKHKSYSIEAHVEDDDFKEIIKNNFPQYISKIKY